MRSFVRSAAFAGATCAAAILSSAPAWAGMGQPSDWQINLQDAATPVMENIHSFNIFLLVIITAFRLLHQELNIPPADMTVKVTGHQWYWSYEYPDNGGFSFDSLMVADKDLKPGQPRLLAVDNEVVVPVNKTVRIQVTAGDVIHSFAVPSFGVKIDALPGRLNESWFKATKEGVYYGQCSELCGRDHAFMPIAVRVVSEAQFNQWLEQAKQRYSAAPTSSRVADVAPAGRLIVADAQ
ncbi:MAG: cytochrome c oxidase subunit II [Rhizobiales bacterium 17-65-6]|nr:MAG: cytochrome c oxidase subunit II [Rhizobiales bacterium 17-65-6]